MQQIITETVFPQGAVRRSHRRGRRRVFFPPPAGGKIKDAVGLKSTPWFLAVKRKTTGEQTTAATVAGVCAGETRLDRLIIPSCTSRAK